MYKEYTGPERRKSKRLEVNFAVIYKIHRPPDIVMMIGGQEIHAVMLDLSKEGMAILTRYELPIKTVLYIKFTLIDLNVTDEDHARNMEIMGIVKYIRHYEKKDFRVGIGFAEISQEDKKFLDSFTKDAK